MRIIAFDPYVSKETGLPNIQLLGLEDLLRESDFISLHAPLTPETKQIINERTISMMKDGVYLINTARGPLVDEQSLIKALKTGKIAGAGLDVYSVEPPAEANQLFELENVVLTPHIAWYTKEAQRRLEMSAVQHAIDILNGKVPSQHSESKRTKVLKEIE